MALSNWDTFAMNEKGEPCKGSFISPKKAEIEIYKNWLYLKDEHVWNKSCDRSSPCIMQIYDARIEYKDISVVSEFVGYTIYVAVWSKDCQLLPPLIGVSRLALPACRHTKGGSLPVMVR